MFLFLSRKQQNLDIRRDHKLQCTMLQCHITGCDFAGRELHAKVVLCDLFPHLPLCLVREGMMLLATNSGYLFLILVVLTWNFNSCKYL
jgi:hypothetical protein